MFNLMAGGFWSSKYKWTYIKLAIKFEVAPYHVYMLAHGFDVEDDTDEEIVNELGKRGIMAKGRA